MVFYQVPGCGLPFKKKGHHSISYLNCGKIYNNKKALCDLAFIPRNALVSEGQLISSLTLGTFFLSWSGRSELGVPLDIPSLTKSKQ